MAAGIFSAILDRTFEECRQWADPRWDELHLQCVTKQNDTHRFLVLSGMTMHKTEGMPKFFVAWKRLSPEETDRLMLYSRSQIHSVVESWIMNLILRLDSYLDERCKCIPGPHGEPGETCAWHEAGCRAKLERQWPQESR